ncbi:MAG: terminase small subunit [Devosia sp.]|uniref:terminase small subunit n=1 Tax=Devosia sp. TaxID=1871048 RepID=UPI001A3860F8|nr:terminase small subunit [Devosia sp.]MBL8599943.1 terminase small subunit [Devosia sp.]
MRCNRTTLAKILGHDVKTIDKMVREGMPCVTRPGGGQRSWVFDTADVLKWMTRDDYEERNKAARSRLLAAKAGIRWLEYGQALGHLVEIDEIIPRLEEPMRMVKSRLLAMPGRLGQLVAAESDPRAVQKILKDEIDDIFENMDRMTKDVLQSFSKKKA